MKPDFPSLADGLAEPHPDMNNKVAAFTVSEKSSNMSPELLFVRRFDSEIEGRLYVKEL